MKLKTVCINLERSDARRHAMLRIADYVPTSFEFFKAYDHRDIVVRYDDCLSVDDDYNVTITRCKHDGELCGKIYHKGEFMGLYHNPKRYLEDRVEHFARKHYNIYRDIPYASPVKCNNVEWDHTKKYINYKGVDQFYVDVVDFRKSMSPSEIACAISHYKVYEQLLSDPDYDAYLILEDDVSIVGEHLQAALDDLELYEPLWDVAHLNKPKFLASQSMLPYSAHWNLGVFSVFTDACSYIVTKEAARQLIDSLHSHIDICADDVLTRHVRLYSLRTKDPIFSNTAQHETHPSTIRTPEIEDDMEVKFQAYNSQGVLVS